MKKSTKATIAAVDIDDPKYQYIVDGIKLLAENGYEIGEYNPRRVSAWLVVNDQIPCVVVAENEQEAIDEAADSGAWDSLFMSEEYLTEYEANGWDDFFMRAGNASEPFWSEYLYIEKLIQA